MTPSTKGQNEKGHNTNIREPFAKAGQVSGRQPLTLFNLPVLRKGLLFLEVRLNTKITDEWGSFSAIPNEFIDAAGDLSDQSRWLFVLLRRYTNGQTGKAFPSYKLIQERTGWTPKTIAKAVRELEEAGWIEREKTFGDVTQYILKRNRHFPQGSEALPTGKRSTSRREVGVLPVGKSNKTDLNKTDSTRPNKEREAQPRQALVVTQAAAIATPPPPTGVADAVSIVLEYFPLMGIWQQELISNADINHLTIWRKCVEDWRDNRYSPRNINGMIDSYFKAESRQAKEKANGTNGTTNRQTAGERKAGEYLALQRKLGENASNDPDYKPLPGFEWLESIR